MTAQDEKPPDARHRADEIEYETHIEVVTQLILDADRPRRICHIVSEKFDVSDRQARRYIRTAHQEIQEIRSRKKEEMHAEHMSVRRHIRNKAMKKGDLRTALAAAQDEAKLFDLYPALKSEITGRDGKPVLQIIYEDGNPDTPAPTKA